MTATAPTLTRDPSDSVLMTLARAAMAPGAEPVEVTWPTLDLNDAKQREFGDYELLEEIGRGGMGVVYRARQRSLDRDVAIKFIAAGIADSFNVARFLGEARAAARLMHPNIVPVHEVGSIDGVHYFSMPLVKGRTLANLLDAGTLAPAAAITLMLKLCDAIDYAHRLGLLHLDLKPANVLLDERDEPLVTDFGLARHMDANGGVDAQEVSGTPSFMAPEQILIKQYRLTPATDLYALGAILYRCLTGVSPHGSGQPDEVIRNAASGRIRGARELNARLSHDLDAVCMKCLELQPNDRYSSVAHLADELRRVRDGNAVTVRPLNVMQRIRRWAHRKPIEAAFWMALIGGILTTTNEMRKAREAEIAAEQARVVAERQRESAVIAGEIGARLYSYRGEDQGRAEDLLGWLRARLPGDEQRQAKALTEFATALKAEDAKAANALIYPLIGVMGVSYRRQVIAALESGQEPGRYALAARLAWFDERLQPDAPNFSRLLELAIAEQPDDVGVWAMAATFCTGAADTVRCHHPEATDQLIRLDPDNAYPWLLLAQSEDGERATAALHEAARRSRFDDHFRTTFAGFRDAILKSRAPLPELILGPARVVAPTEKPEYLVVIAESSPFPITTWGSLMKGCDPAHPESTASVRADCLAIGMLMRTSKATLVTRHIGGTIVRRLSRGQPLEQQMVRLARQWFYIRDMTFEKLTLDQKLSYSSERLIADIIEQGELEAWANRLEHFGIASEPPEYWQPADPNLLMLPEERGSGS